jgi:hypothetical protein
VGCLNTSGDIKEVFGNAGLPNLYIADTGAGGSQKRYF